MRGRWLRPSEQKPIARSCFVALFAITFECSTALAQCSAPGACVSGPFDLGVLVGSEMSLAFGISADGTTAVGVSSGTGSDRPFRWTSAGMQDLGSLGGNRGVAYGISADGNVIVGYSSTSWGGVKAFRWTAAGGMAEIGTLAACRTGFKDLDPLRVFAGSGALQAPVGSRRAWRGPRLAPAMSAST